MHNALECDKDNRFLRAIGLYISFDRQSIQIEYLRYQRARHIYEAAIRNY